MPTLLDIKLLGLGTLMLSSYVVGVEARRSIQAALFETSESTSRMLWRPPKDEAQVVHQILNDEWSSEKLTDRTTNAANLAVDSVQSPLAWVRPHRHPSAPPRAHLGARGPWFLIWFVSSCDAMLFSISTDSQTRCERVKPV